jgi:hypothetical protein
VSNTQHSAAELLPELLNDEGVLNGEGSIAFTRPDKTTARIFLSQGNIYAVDNLEYENNLWSELRFEEHITHGNLRALIRAHKSQRDSLYKLLKRTRNKIKNQDNLVISLQEYVLGAIDNIYSWESVQVEWRMGDTFQYDAANVPPFHLTHLLTLCVNRSLFKFKKYEEWGFKNDDQFLYGNVLIESAGEVESTSLLEETILFAKKFVIKGLIENTGYSIFTIASALDDLSKRVKVNIENPSGRQKPVNQPQIPHDVPVVRDKVYFSVTDEDPEMSKMFNTEYHVPEPAVLEDNQETFNSEHKVKEDDDSNDVFKSYDDVINDTSSMEILNVNLPELQKEKEPSSKNSRPQIPQEDLDREESANDIQALYKSMEKEVPKARGAVRKLVAPEKDLPKEDAQTNAEFSEDENSETPVESSTPEIVTDDTIETIETLTSELKGNKMSSESSLFAILEQLDSQLSNQKNKIEEHKRKISEKEALLQEAKNKVNLLTMELANEIGAKETATTEYEKALTIINSLNN